MNSDLTISSSGNDSQEPSLLPEEANLALSNDESTPGSDSSSSQAELGSEPKKQKIEEAAGEKSSDEVADEDASGSEEDEEEDTDDDAMVWTQTPSEPLLMYPEDAKGQAKFDLYYKQIEESEGFDFDEFPPVDAIMSGVVPVIMDGVKHAPRVRECVRFVIEQHNAENKGVSRLECNDDDILKANYAFVDGINYYITFKATEILSSDPGDATKVYQAEVYRQRDGTMETTLFRVKGQTQLILGEEDRPQTYM